MKRNPIFFNPGQAAVWILSIGLILIAGCSKPAGRDYYQLKIYSIDNEQQQARMDDYLRNAYIPALHRAGIPAVGVFKPVESDANRDKRILVLIPFQSLDEFEAIDRVLDADEAYREAGRDYIDAMYDNVPYQRIESILLRAFAGSPGFRVPDHATARPEQIYELRSYQGPTEEYYKRKVEMFNEAGEIGLFLKLGFQPVFFGEVISGPDMPNLMYLTTFADTTSQQEHWNAFRDDPDWLRIKEIERYLNTVSHSDRYYLHPAGYSDL
jgi:hypothetical protein